MEFAELLAKTNYSFLEGASTPEEMVFFAKEIGYSALGIVDRSGVYGIPRAHIAAKKIHLPLVIGAEVRLRGEVFFLLARNRNGYGNLCELLTAAHRSLDAKNRGTAEAVSVPLESLELFSGDLFLLAPPRSFRIDFLPQLREAFFDRLYIVASRFLDNSHLGTLRAAEEAESLYQLPCIVSNLPLFHTPKRKALQDVLTCIRHTVPLSRAGFKLLPNRARHLKPIGELRKLFEGHPEWLSNTMKIAQDCTFGLDEIRYRYPSEWLPPGETGISYLRKLVFHGTQERYPQGVPEAVQRQVTHELALIEDLEYPDYFLTIWDIVQFAKQRQILCQGRGSAANSIVCYVLEITAIDPVRMNLLFERFISRERSEPPDIDIDFEHERREEVIQYIYQRYGRHRAAITAEVICFRKRSAIREVAKIFEMPTESVGNILTLTHRTSMKEIPMESYEQALPSVPSARLQQYLAAVRSIQGFPRHLGTHVGGFVLCQEALSRNCPIENAAMEERTIIQWDKNDLDNLGFVRVDILGLGILTCIRKSLDYLRENYSTELSLSTIPSEDPKVYEAACRGDTVGVFQIESRAQMNMLPRLKPKTFYDLVVEISLVRPGPIQGDMVHPYLRRRMGKERIDMPHPDLESILGRTYGVPIFQEQVMKMAMAVAGFSPGEADELRRAMGAWRRDGKERLNEIGQKFHRGMLKHGIQSYYADRICSQIEGFAEYGFPESHAASFAILAYVTLWLKVHHPDIFLMGLLNSQPMGFYSSHTLIYDAKRHRVQIEGVDVQYSDSDNRLEAPMKVRLGFREVNGLPSGVALAIEKARSTRPFLNLEDFVSRTQAALQSRPLTKRDLFLLAGANAYRSLGLERRLAFWEVQGLTVQDSPYLSPSDIPPNLPSEQVWESMSLDYEAQRVTLDSHPMAYLRPELEQRGIENSKSIGKYRKGRKVKVAGIVICRQMPDTASGVFFVSLEDEFGFINLVIWNKIYQQFKAPLTTASFLLCEGKIQKADAAQVTHVIVESAKPLLTQSSNDMNVSHDFR